VGLLSLILFLVGGPAFFVVFIVAFFSSVTGALSALLLLVDLLLVFISAIAVFFAIPVAVATLVAITRIVFGMLSLILFLFLCFLLLDLDLGWRLYIDVLCLLPSGLLVFKHVLNEKTRPL
jgi:hypothetical protein